MVKACIAFVVFHDASGLETTQKTGACASWACTQNSDCTGTPPAMYECASNAQCINYVCHDGSGLEATQKAPEIDDLKAGACNSWACMQDSDCTGTPPAMYQCAANAQCISNVCQDWSLGANATKEAAEVNLKTGACHSWACTQNSDCTGTPPAMYECASNAQCINYVCHDGSGLEAKQTCDYYGCTGDADCATYPAKNVCGSSPKCDMRWGATGKCYAAAAELEAKQTCDYYGCTGDADCATYPASTVCGSSPKCDMRWGATGKCYAAAAELEAKQTCDYYGCTGDADCGTYPASTVCGSSPKCDMRWGATGKCYAAGAEANLSTGACHSWACTQNSDCTGTPPAMYECASNAQCINYVCHDGSGLEAKQTCDYYGCTGDADCATYPAKNVCGSSPKCDMRWGATGKCYAAAAELEAKQTCDYYGCTGDADCATYPASTVCGSSPKCDMRWGATGKCYAAGAEANLTSGACHSWACTQNSDCTGTPPAMYDCASNAQCINYVCHDGSGIMV